MCEECTKIFFFFFNKNSERFDWKFLGHRRNCSCTCLSSENSTAGTRNGLLKANLHGTKLSRTTFFSYHKRLVRIGCMRQREQSKTTGQGNVGSGNEGNTLSTISAQGNSVCWTKTDFRDDSLVMKHFKRLAFVCVYFSANVR